MSASKQFGILLLAGIIGLAVLQLGERLSIPGLHSFVSTAEAVVGRPLSGTMTRSQRRQRIETLVAQIKDAEQQQVQTAATAQEQEMERVRRIAESMRGFD
jgi:ABC-type phosphate transport system auxiliary subunit